MRRNTTETFWSRVDKSGGPDACWPYTGRIKPPIGGMTHGHGCYDHDGTWDYAHRYAYTLSMGEPVGWVCHTCDYPPCCNPAHLYDGNALTNAADRDRRGRRNVRGERSPRAQLTEAQVREILTTPRVMGYRKVLAEKYDVKPCTISAIVGRRRWDHVNQANAGVSGTERPAATGPDG